MLNKSYIETLIKKYQRIFRLQDWDIILRMPKKVYNGRFADTDCNQTTRKVIMTVYNNDLYGKEVGIEEVVRHEFGHILNSELMAYIRSLHNSKALNDTQFEMWNFFNERYACQFERMKDLEKL